MHLGVICVSVHKSLLAAAIAVSVSACGFFDAPHARARASAPAPAHATPAALWTSGCFWASNKDVCQIAISDVPPRGESEPGDEPPQRLMPIYIALAWVDPQTGHIVASAHGVAVDQENCVKIAQQAIALALQDPAHEALKRTVPIINCWDVRVQLKHIPYAAPRAPRALPPGSTQL